MANKNKNPFEDLVMSMREQSIFTPEGRMYMIANAHAYGYEVNNKGVIVDKKGKELDIKDKDYMSITERAKRQARTSVLFEELLDNPMEGN